MQVDKFKFKVTRSQLDVLYGLVIGAATLRTDSLERKLLVSHMIEIHKKILAKWSYPSPKMSIVFTPCEAMAFWLMFKDIKEVSLNNPFVFATIDPLLTQIHQKYS